VVPVEIPISYHWQPDGPPTAEAQEPLMSIEWTDEGSSSLTWEEYGRYVEAGAPTVVYKR
jgi:hypothetical protein